MATRLYKTVEKDGNGDYTSLEACMNDNEQNLVTADKYFDVEICGTDLGGDGWDSADSTAVTIENYTTDATRYINIYTTASARHNGTAESVSGNDSYRINLSNATNSPIKISSQYVTLTGIEVTNWSGNHEGIEVTANNTILDKLIVHNGNSSYAGIFGDSIVAVFKNCIIYDIDDDYGIYAYGPDDTKVLVYNCTVYNCKNGIYSATFLGAKNCISYGNTNNDYVNTFGNVGTITVNNLSSDATSPNSAYRNKTLSFVNTTSGSEDLHLDSGDTDAIGEGVDLSGIFTDDIDGDTRSSWDIGADEYVSEGGSPSPSPSTSVSASPSTSVSSSPSSSPSAPVQTSLQTDYWAVTFESSPSSSTSASPSTSVSASPSSSPSTSVSSSPSSSPSTSVSSSPSTSPSSSPSTSVSSSPSESPSTSVSASPSTSPSTSVSSSPSSSPSTSVSSSPSSSPSTSVSASPSTSVSASPSTSVSSSPSTSPSTSPSSSPSGAAAPDNTIIIYADTQLKVYVDGTLTWSFDDA